MSTLKAGDLAFFTGCGSSWSGDAPQTGVVELVEFVPKGTIIACNGYTLGISNTDAWAFRVPGCNYTYGAAARCFFPLDGSEEQRKVFMQEPLP